MKQRTLIINPHILKTIPNTFMYSEIGSSVSERDDCGSTGLYLKNEEKVSRNPNSRFIKYIHNS